jgi:hypothetical protein
MLISHRDVFLLLVRALHLEVEPAVAEILVTAAGGVHSTLGFGEDRFDLLSGGEAVHLIDQLGQVSALHQYGVVFSNDQSTHRMNVTLLRRTLVMASSAHVVFSGQKKTAAPLRDSGLSAKGMK